MISEKLTQYSKYLVLIIIMEQNLGLCNICFVLLFSNYCLMSVSKIIHHF